MLFLAPANPCFLLCTLYLPYIPCTVYIKAIYIYYIHHSRLYIVYILSIYIYSRLYIVQYIHYKDFTMHTSHSILGYVLCVLCVVVYISRSLGPLHVAVLPHVRCTSIFDLGLLQQAVLVSCAYLLSQCDRPDRR